jgi:hypothetical protein
LRPILPCVRAQAGTADLPSLAIDGHYRIADDIELNLRSQPVFITPLN